MTSKSILLVMICCFTLSSCATFALVGAAQENTHALQTADFDSASTAVKLHPHEALYTSKTFEWQDSARKRHVPARLYLPTVDNGAVAQPVPLIVFSHGLGGSRDGYQYLGRYFASNGYASLHLQHVGSDRQLWFGNPFYLLERLNGAAKESEAIDRARDLSFALDRLLENESGKRVDWTRIVATGHSYGANTAMLAAGALVEHEGNALPLRDKRVMAAILLSAPPFYGSTDTARILAGIDIPTLHITATDDDIILPGYCSGVADRLAVYQAIGNGHAASKVLAVFKGGSHGIFTDRMRTGGKALNPKVKAATSELVVAFMNALFMGDANALKRWQQRNADLVERFDQQPAFH